MVSITVIAFFLLLFRLVSMVFIGLVIKRQWELMKYPIDKEIRTFRKILLVLSLVIFVGNLIPIAIDTLTLFVETGRPDSLRTISIMYAFSNSLTAMTSALLIWLLYWIAGQSNKSDVVKQ